jgi:UDP-N-acetylmuramyl pentapeptide phosphotransferase/UDP-N-acetylglucosamine-1-phosphate transferase
VLRFLLTTFVTALTLPFFLKWSRSQAEGQIDKMQRGVHGTPGVESPVPPVVLLGGVGLLAGHWVFSRLLGLGFLSWFISLIAGIGAGFGFYLFGVSGQE